MNIVELLKKGIDNINTICAKYINKIIFTSAIGARLEILN